MKTSKIILVEVNFRHELISIKGSPSTFGYYSNLTLAYEALKETLLLNEWELDGFNYTAIYRAIKQRGVYVKVFKSKGTAFFKVSINQQTLNPKLNTLDIVKNPF